MSPRTVRITVWSTCIASSILFLLYLPVLIWSPPWSVNGYYVYEKDGSLAKFNEGELLIDKNISIVGVPLVQKVDIVFDENDGEWTNKHNSSNQLKFSSRGMQFIQDGQTESYNKISNPFTVWYIKWLEWTD